MPPSTALGLIGARGVPPRRSIADIKASLAAQGLKDTAFIDGWCRFHEDILLPGALGVPSLGVLGWMFFGEAYYQLREWLSYRFGG